MSTSLPAKALQLAAFGSILTEEQWLTAGGVQRALPARCWLRFQVLGSRFKGRRRQYPGGAALRGGAQDPCRADAFVQARDSYFLVTRIFHRQDAKSPSEECSLGALAVQFSYVSPANAAPPLRGGATDALPSLHGLRERLEHKSACAAGRGYRPIHVAVLFAKARSRRNDAAWGG